MSIPEQPEVILDAQDLATGARVRRRAIAQLLVCALLLAVIFLWLLPQFISYAAVWDAITSLQPWQTMVLLGIGFVLIGFTAAIYTCLMPGLGYWPGTTAWLGATTASFVLPPPLDIPIRFAVYKRRGIDVKTTGSGLVLSWIFTSGIKFVLPVFALIALALRGEGGQHVELWALVGSIAVMCGAVVIFVVLHAEGLAVRMSESLVSRYNRWLAGHFHLPYIVEVADHVKNFRSLMTGTLRTSWPRATTFGLLTQLLTFTTLVISLRFVGVGSDEVDLQLAWVAFAAGMLLSMIPILPGGLGAVELAYVTIMSDGNEAIANAVGAAAFLCRIFTWLLPIVLGIWPLLHLRRPTDADSALSTSTA